MPPGSCLTGPRRLCYILFDLAPWALGGAGVLKREAAVLVRSKGDGAEGNTEPSLACRGRNPKRRLPGYTITL